jgi:hypothetical protein
VTGHNIGYAFAAKNAGMLGRFLACWFSSSDKLLVTEAAAG